MKLFALFLLADAAFAQSFPFTVQKAGEVIATIEMAAAGTDWSVRGKEAAMVDVQVDARPAVQVMLFAGPEKFPYQVLLGSIGVGAHTLRVSGSYAGSATFAESQDVMVRHAPMLYERKTAIGQFTDIPLILYCERNKNVLEYTVIFSNEDGGTSTRGLMARWGRTTDIEYVYRVTIDAEGNRIGAIIQGRGHNDIAFIGPFEGDHPLLIPVTQNNMVAGEGPSAVRYNLVPALLDLSAASRELAMDRNPITWRVMAQELIRESKLRRFGKVEGEKTGDIRNYLFIEARIKNDHSRTAALVRLKGEGRWRTSNLGRLDLAIERDGWIRTTVELPPGTKANQIGEIGFACLAADKEKEAGVCKVDAVSKAFLLNAEYLPDVSFFEQRTAVEIPSGEIFAWTLK